MLQVRFRVVELKKLYPLAISRGISTGSTNLFVEVEDENGNVGLGECAPGTGFDESLAPIAEEQLKVVVAKGIDGKSIHQVWEMMRAMDVNASAMAAMDVALWDLLGKQCGQPLYKVLGLSKTAVVTSVTIGINPPEVTRERVPEILTRTGGRSLKIKLGSSLGIEHDKEHYMAAMEASKDFNVSLRIDANGGWNVSNALHMMDWLKDRRCDYVEQPLARGEEAGLPELYANRPMPIYADESCQFSSDVPKLMGMVDGVNLKLMKCGGITEALRIVSAAKACGMGTMIGCMGESSVAISAGAAMSELFDFIDLDSQINLNPDPATGAPMINGVVTPTDAPGHGASLN